MKGAHHRAVAGGVDRKQTKYNQNDEANEKMFEIRFLVWKKQLKEEKDNRVSHTHITGPSRLEIYKAFVIGNGCLGLEE